MEAIRLLNRLVELKDYKDKHGKTGYYIRTQAKLWNEARKLLRDGKKADSDKETLVIADVSNTEGKLFCSMAGKGVCPYEKQGGECIMKDPCKNHATK